MRFLLATLFAVFLASASAAAGAHGPAVPGGSGSVAVTAALTADCDNSCGHGAAICVQLCIAHFTCTPCDGIAVALRSAKTQQLAPTDLLLSGRMTAPQLFPPIA